MKKTMILTAFLGILSLASYAQIGAGEGALPKGSIVANLGVGLGNDYWGSSYGTSLPVSPTLTVDYALTDKIGIGNIAVGGVVSYSTTKFTDGAGDYWRYSGILIGARGSYHFILNNDKLDPYAGAMLGYVINHATYHSADGVNGLDINAEGKSNSVQPGLFAGVHYYLKPSFGVYGEVGFNGFSVVNIGVSFKF